MAKYKKENGTTQVGDFLRSLGSVGKPILKAAGNLTGQAWLSNIADGIRTSKDLSDEQKEHALELHTLDAKDRASSRDMNTAIQISSEANSMAKNAPYVLAYTITAMFGALLSFLIFKDVPDGNKEILYVLSGSLGTLVISVFAFFFGSSVGSKDKTEGMIKSFRKK